MFNLAGVGAKRYCKSATGPLWWLQAEVCQLISFVSAKTQVWTYHGRAAFVLSVTEKGQPVVDNIKVQRLKQILLQLIDDNHEGLVNIKKV